MQWTVCKWEMCKLNSEHKIWFVIYLAILLLFLLSLLLFRLLLLLFQLLLLSLLLPQTILDATWLRVSAVSAYDEIYDTWAYISCHKY